MERNDRALVSHCRWPLEAGEGVTPFFRSLLAQTSRDRNGCAARTCSECACALLHASSCFLIGQVRCWQCESDRQRLPRFPDTSLPCGPASQPSAIQPRKQTAAHRERESVKLTKETNGANRHYDKTTNTLDSAMTRTPEGKKTKEKQTPTKRLDDDAETKFFVLRFQWFCLPFFVFFFLLFRARVYTRSKTHKSTQT